MKRAIIFIAFLCAVPVLAQQNPAWPIKASANNRYFVDQNNAPWIMVADAAHHLMPVVPQSSVAAYLSNRQTNQFDTIDLYALCTGGTCGTTFAAQDGTLPFTTGTSPSNYDISTPNPSYWAEVDSVITQAKADGLTVLLFVCPWGNGCSTMLNNGVNTLAKDYAFGQFIGNRYKSFTNVIYAMGDDYDQTVLPSAANLALEARIAAGIASNDTTHLITYQFNFNGSYAQQALSVCSNPSQCFTDFSTTLTYSNTYDYFELYDLSIAEYNASPTLPAIMIESNYETANNTGSLSCTASGNSPSCPQGSVADALITREQMWWPVTSGTIGGFEFGNAHINHFDAGYATSFNTTATLQVKYVDQLLRQLPWWTLAPECTSSCGTAGNHALISSGFGTYNASNLNLFGDGSTQATYVSGAWDGSKYAVIYTPRATTTLTLNMAKFTQTEDVAWYDPTTGNFMAITGSPFANSGTHTFSTPGTHSDGTGASDWVLVAAPANACPSTVPTGVTTCYYVSDSGSNANNGTSELDPWLFSPGMNSCSSVCAGVTIAAGKGFVFRGGDTWHFGNASATPYAGVKTACWAGSGTAGACWGALTPSAATPIYFGVDPSWYSSSSWTRPIFTADNSPCNGTTLGTLPDGATCSLGTDPTGFGQTVYVVSSCPYQIGTGNDLIVFANSQNVYLDNFEMTGICMNQVGQPGSQNIYILWNAASGPIYVSNDYIHNSSHLQFQGSNGHSSCTASNICFDSYVFNGNGNADGDGGIITNTVVDFSDSDPSGTGVCSPGTYMYDTHDSVFRYNSQCIPKGVHVMHDNLWEYYYENGHSNLWEDVETSPAAAIYDNVFRHMFGALVFWPGPSASTDVSYFFNNVTYDVTTAQYFDYGGTGVQANGGQYRVFNNTFQSNGSSSVVIACAATGNVFNNLNNHFIDDISAYPSSCTGMTNTTVLGMTNSTATTDGYTSSQTFGYSPIAGNSPTVGTGTNQYTGYCSTLLASADSLIQAAGTACRLDTTYSCTYNTTNHTVSCPARTAVARPTSATWDVGAYQFGAGAPQAQTPVPSPAAGTYIGSRTVTLSNPSGAPVICYNTTGSPATNSGIGCAAGSTAYSGGIIVGVSESLFFVAGGTGFIDSAVGAAAYTILPVGVRGAARVLASIPATSIGGLR